MQPGQHMVGTSQGPSPHVAGPGQPGMNTGMKPGPNRMQIPNMLQQQSQQGHQGMVRI